MLFKLRFSLYGDCIDFFGWDEQVFIEVKIFFRINHIVFSIFLLLMAWILNNGQSYSAPLPIEDAAIHLCLKHINQNVRTKIFSSYNVSFMVVKFNRSKKPGPVCSGIFSIFCNFPFLQRFARNPECRIRISFFGRAWRRNRRINSLALRGMDLFLLSFLRSL